MRYPKAWTMFLPFSLLFLFINSFAFAEVLNSDKDAAFYERILRDARIKKLHERSVPPAPNVIEYMRSKLEEMGIPFETEEFIYLIQKGDRETAGRFLLAGMSPNTTDQDGTPALIWAVRTDQIEMVRLLLFCSKHNAELAYEDVEIDGRDQTGETPLMWALKGNHDEIAELLIMEYADIDTLQNGNGETPLARATRNGNINILKLMLKEGAEVDKKNADGETPLMLAAKNGHHAIVRLLLRNWANVNIKGADGKTALELATEKRRKKIIKLLSDSSVNVDHELQRKEWIRKEREEFPSKKYIPLAWFDTDTNEFVTEKFNVTVIRPNLMLTRYLETAVDHKKNFSEKWVDFKNAREVPTMPLTASAIIDNTKTLGCTNKKIKKALGTQIDISYAEAGFFNLAIDLEKYKVEGITLMYHGGRFGSVDSIAYMDFLEKQTSIILNKPFILDRFVTCQDYYVQNLKSQYLDDILDVDGLCDHINSCRPDPSIGVRLGTEFLDNIRYEINEEHKVLVVGE